MGLLDVKVDVVLARLEADFRAQPPGIPAAPNHQVSLQCPTTKYPCNAQSQNINILAAHLQRCKEDSGQGGGKRYIHLCNEMKAFRVGMLEVNNL